MLREILVSGGAIFAMFFGAGNMVFPVILGQQWGPYWVSAISGFSLTGIFVPLLGLISIVLLRGNSDKFFGCLGIKLSILMQACIMIIEGPFGIVPRAITVGFGGIKSICPAFNPTIYFFICSVIIWFLTIRRDRIVPIIGKILTPIKLSLLIFLIIFGLYGASHIGVTELTFSSTAFWEGTSYGYQTYDLPAAIYFAAMVIGYFYESNKSQSKKDLLIHGMLSCLLCAFLLGIMYFAFGYISANYSAIINGLPKEDMLPILVKISIGNFSYYLFGAIIFIACITTAVAATSIWSTFIDNLFPDSKLVTHERVVVCSVIIAFLIANLGFDAIVDKMSSVLIILYPILILLTVYNIYRSLVSREDL